MKLGRQMPELIGETVWLNGQYDKADLIGRKADTHPFLVNQL